MNHPQEAVLKGKNRIKCHQNTKTQKFTKGYLSAE